MNIIVLLVFICLFIFPFDRSMIMLLFEDQGMRVKKKERKERREKRGKRGKCNQTLKKLKEKVRKKKGKRGTVKKKGTRD